MPEGDKYHNLSIGLKNKYDIPDKYLIRGRIKKSRINVQELLEYITDEEDKQKLISVYKFKIEGAINEILNESLEENNSDLSDEQVNDIVDGEDNNDNSLDNDNKFMKEENNDIGEKLKMNIKIINNDCLEELVKLPDNSIDCVLTDPPYFIDKLDNKWDSSKVRNDSNSHIKHLPKGMKFSKSQVKELYDFYLKLSVILMDKLKPGGYFLSFSSPRLYHAIAMSCEIGGFEIRDMINWTYTQSMPKGMSVNHIIDKMSISYEEKQKIKSEYAGFKTPMIRSCFEPICVAMKPIGKLTFIKNELEFKTGLLDFNQTVGIDNDRTPANVITTEEFNEMYDKNFMISKPSKEEKGVINTHITVKPLKLIEHLIRLFSKKGSLVVDPFLGSGTTALACKNTSRNCLGYEINKEYYDICLKRLL